MRSDRNFTHLFYCAITLLQPNYRWEFPQKSCHRHPWGAYRHTKPFPNSLCIKMSPHLFPVSALLFISVACTGWTSINIFGSILYHLGHLTHSNCVECTIITWHNPKMTLRQLQHAGLIHLKTGINLKLRKSETKQKS